MLDNMLYHSLTIILLDCDERHFLRASVYLLKLLIWKIYTFIYLFK